MTMGPNWTCIAADRQVIEELNRKYKTEREDEDKSYNNLLRKLLGMPPGRKRGRPKRKKVESK